MLGLGAVDVHGLVVGDGNHEGGRVCSLAATVGGVGGTLGVTGNGLEVGEEGVCLGLAGRVCVGGSHTVVLGGEHEGDSVTGLSGDGVWGELELVVGGNRDHHSGSGCGQALGENSEDDVGEEHDGGNNNNRYLGEV